MLDLEERLNELQSSGLRRRLRVIEGPQGPRVLLDGRAVLLLCSNNYLGLADHPRIRRAAVLIALGCSLLGDVPSIVESAASPAAEVAGIVCVVAASAGVLREPGTPTPRD